MIGMILKKVFGTANDRELKRIQVLVDKINAQEPAISGLPDAGLRAKTDEFKKRLEEGETLDDILPEVFAVVREASKRTLGMRHFDVQLIVGCRHPAGIEEEIMRKIITGLFMSLDGVVEAPFSWASAYFNDEMFNWIGAGLPGADAILLGRRTYLEFAGIWPSQGSSVPMADFLNNTPKYVVSSTLDALEWGPAALMRGDLVGEISALKQQPGKNIQVPGSPTLVRWLLRNGLLDELSLGIAPIVVGSGMRLFEETGEHLPLNLAESGALSTGMLTVTYPPAPAPDQPAAPSCQDL